MNKHDLVLLADQFAGKGHLFLIRGVPGSGKTTYAKKLLEEYNNIVHIEADMFFERTGQYLFDREKLHTAHNWCLNTAQILLNQGVKVIVANTFTTYKEVKDYLNYAKRNGHGITLVTMGTEYGSIHNVPEDVLQAMRERLQDHDYIRKQILEDSK